MSFFSEEISRETKTGHLCRFAGKGRDRLLIQEPKINHDLGGQQLEVRLSVSVGRNKRQSN